MVLINDKLLIINNFLIIIIVARYIQEKLEDTFDDYVKDLQILRRLLQICKKQDPEGIYELEVEPLKYDIKVPDTKNNCAMFRKENNLDSVQFKRLMVLPSCSIALWKANEAKILSADASHMSGRLDCVCNSMVAIDANRQNLTLGYSISLVENADNWIYTANHIFTKLHGIQMLISDRDKA